MKKINRLITYVLRITKGDIDVEFNEVYENINKLITPFKDENILFPLVCWIDEIILASKWNSKNQWIDYMLQVKYFHINNGGELFFEKLEEVEEKKYYILMLKLGFKGKYFDNPEIIEKILKKYTPKWDISTLFPFAYTKKPLKKRKFISNIYNYKTVIFLIIIIILIYGVYYFNLEELMKSKGLL